MLDFARRAVRSAIGAAERVEGDVERHTPLADEERRLHDAVAALRRAADSLERHVQAIDTLAESLDPLTQSVNGLSGQITELMAVVAPLATAEREVSRFEHLLRRRRREGASSDTPATP